MLIDATPFIYSSLIRTEDQPYGMQAGALTTELRPETQTETGDTAWLPAQLAGRWGQSIEEGRAASKSPH